MKGSKESSVINARLKSASMTGSSTIKRHANASVPHHGRVSCARSAPFSVVRMAKSNRSVKAATATQHLEANGQAKHATNVSMLPAKMVEYWTRQTVNASVPLDTKESHATPATSPRNIARMDQN